MKRIIFTIIAVASLGLVASNAASATDKPKPDPTQVIFGGQDQKICHKVQGEGETKNGFNIITVSVASIVDEKGDAHSTHQDGQDIIPAFSYTITKKYPGNDWPDEVTTGFFAGQGNAALINAECGFVPPPPTKVTAGVTPIQATCTSGVSLSFANEDKITYVVTGTVAAGNTVSVAATAKTGYVIDGQSVFSVTFAAAPTNCNPPPPERCPPPNPDGSYGGKDGKLGNDECVADPVPPTPPVSPTPPVVETPASPPIVTPPAPPAPELKPVKPEPKLKPKALPKPVTAPKPVSEQPTVTSTSGETLPYTGANVWLLALAGLALTGGGLALRRL